MSVLKENYCTCVQVVRACSHMGVDNQNEIDKGGKNNAKFIIAGKMRVVTLISGSSMEDTFG